MGVRPRSRTPLISIRLLADSTAPWRARAHVDGLTLPLGHARWDDLRLLVSELVTNSVRHAGLRPEHRIVLEVRVGEHSVRVEVRDAGSGFVADAPSLPPADELGGRGLYLLAAVSDRWGVSRDGGTVVWFELDRDRDPRLNGAGYSPPVGWSPT